MRWRGAPAAPGHAATLLRVSALMFADDFAGLAGSAAQLQAGVSAARAWCDKWRMQANVGPGKSAVMLFAPEAAAQPLGDGDLVWGGALGAPLPVAVSTKLQVPGDGAGGQLPLG